MIDYKLYLIRHGLTQGNLDGQYIGVTDLPLCREGERQLRKLKKLFVYPDVQTVYVPPFKRYQGTASILYPGLQQRPAEGLGEYHFGIFEGRRAADLKDFPAFRRWMEDGMRSAPEGGEAPQDFLARCETGFLDVVEDMMRSRITSAALILSGGVMMNLLATHAYPQQEPIYWKSEPGTGYTALITPQVWHRGQVLEAFDPIPYRKNGQNESESFVRFDLEEEEE